MAGGHAYLTDNRRAYCPDCRQEAARAKCREYQRQLRATRKLASHRPTACRCGAPIVQDPSKRAQLWCSPACWEAHYAPRRKAAERTKRAARKGKTKQQLIAAGDYRPTFRVDLPVRGADGKWRRA